MNVSKSVVHTNIVIYAFVLNTSMLKPYDIYPVYRVKELIQAVAWKLHTSMIKHSESRKKLISVCPLDSFNAAE